MSSNDDTLRDIPNGKPVRIYLPVIEGPEPVRGQCLYQVKAPPKFTLVFKHGMLPVEDIDISRPCIISIDMGGPTITLEAMIQEITNPQTLQMIVRKTISHEQMREFFRVDATTMVVSKAFRTEFVGDINEEWVVQGHTVDISGSGILALFTERPPVEDQVRLDISIPSPEPETAEALAHQVRSRQLKNGLYEVAYHFDDISTEDRDKIIGCCLDIQRQMLRLKVKVKDNTI
jgi:hypothetical protein